MTPHFRTIVIDPPWPERGGGKSKRGADRHYKVIKVAEMPRVILSASCWQPHDNAHLYLWVTNTHLLDGGWLMETLGFTYKTCITWEKVTQDGEPYTGLGQYFRGQTEHMLFGTRGRGYDVRTARRDLRTLLEAGEPENDNSFKAPVGEHSEKPPEAYELIEARSKGPHLEMFARRRWKNWAYWGNQRRAA